MGFACQKQKKHLEHVRSLCLWQLARVCAWAFLTLFSGHPGLANWTSLSCKTQLFFVSCLPLRLCTIEFMISNSTMSESVGMVSWFLLQNAILDYLLDNCLNRLFTRHLLDSQLERTSSRLFTRHSLNNPLKQMFRKHNCQVVSYIYILLYCDNILLRP